MEGFNREGAVNRDDKLLQTLVPLLLRKYTSVPYIYPLPLSCGNNDPLPTGKGLIICACII